MAERFTVVGSLGGDPDRRTTKTGDPYITFSVASNERRREEGGAWVDAGTSWFEISVFGALARNSADLLRKGTRVIVLGDLTVPEWTAFDGRKGRSARIRATAIGHELTFGAPDRVRASAPAEPVAAPNAWSTDPAPSDADAEVEQDEPAWASTPF